MAQDRTPTAGEQSPQPKPAQPQQPISSIQRRDVRTAVAKNRGW